MSNQKAYILIGLPGSGKSTWTEKKMRELNPRGIGVVSRDAIRHMINGSYKYIDDQQDLITKIAAETSKAILDRGEDLIVDQANMTQAVRKEVVNFLRAIEDEIEIYFIYMETNVVEFLVQRRMQGDARGENEEYHRRVIEKMKKKFETILDSEDYNVLETIDAQGENTGTYKRNVDKQKVEEEIPMEELWGLDYTIAKFIYPRLVKFRKYHRGASAGHEYKNGRKRYSDKYGAKGDKSLYAIRWNEILDRMIKAFELWLSKDDWDCEYDSKEHKKRWHQIEEGFNLFIKHFNGLWW